MKRKTAAILMTAVLTAVAAVSGNGMIPAQADEQQNVSAEQFQLPDFPMKEGQKGDLTIPEYEKAISFMYSSDNTKAVVVDGKGDLSLGSEIVTGEAVVTVSVMYNYKTVDTKDYSLKTIKNEEGFYIADTEGNPMTSVAQSGIRYEMAVEDDSVATVELNNRSARITAVKEGKTTLTLTGYVGTMVFGKGSCEISVAPNGNPKPQESVTPPAVSEEPVASPEPSREPVASPEVSQEPVVSPEVSENPATSEPQQRLSGDADGNGKVELADAQLVLKAALKISVIEDEAVIKAVDMDNNGKIELADAQYILKKALKIIE